MQRLFRKIGNGDWEEFRSGNKRLSEEEIKILKDAAEANGSEPVIFETVEEPMFLEYPNHTLQPCA